MPYGRSNCANCSMRARCLFTITSCLPYKRDDVVPSGFDELQMVSDQLQRLGVLGPIAALVVDPEELVVPRVLVAEQYAYDVRSSTEFRRQRRARPSQVMSCPAARPRLLEDDLRPAIPVVQFATSCIRKYKVTTGPVSLSHLRQHQDGLPRQRDDVRLRRCMLFACTAACVLSPPGGDRPVAGGNVYLVPGSRTDFV